MSKLATVAVTLLLVLPPWVVTAQQPAPTVQPTRFVGTWVGTQSWAIANPPPGARQDQPVTLTIDVVEGKIIGSLKPFLGGEDGASIVDARIVGEELRATAIVGGAPGSAPGSRRGGAPRGWKEPIRIAFTFRNEGLQGLNLVGTADVTMSDVPWMKYKYELSKKRSRY